MGLLLHFAQLSIHQDRIYPFDRAYQDALTLEAQVPGTHPINAI
jgi:hypothetical protein